MRGDDAESFVEALRVGAGGVSRQLDKATTLRASTLDRDADGRASFPSD
jgi:hypothetical protein